MDDQASAAKLLSLRKQLTTAYDNRVAATKANHDPRLQKGNKKRTYLTSLKKPSHTYPILTFTLAKTNAGLNVIEEKQKYVIPKKAAAPTQEVQRCPSSEPQGPPALGPRVP